MSKIETSLLLDEDALAAGERFSATHGTSLSTLVSDFLRRLPSELPDDIPPDITSPAVRRLCGIARGGQTDEAAYHDYLWRKYGGE